MEEHTWEQMSVDEYFMKFLCVNPTLTYDNTDIGRSTYALQCWLLDCIRDETMSAESVRQLYVQVKCFNEDRHMHVASVEARCLQIIHEAKKEAINSRLTYINGIIASNKIDTQQYINEMR